MEKQNFLNKYSSNDVDVSLSDVKQKDKRFNVKIDLTKLSEFLGKENGVTRINGYVTDAQYSDDYDFGCVNNYIYSLSDIFYYNKNSTLKVVVYLIKPLNLSLKINDKIIRGKLKSKSYCDNVLVYEYEFKGIPLEKDDSEIDFHIKQ